MAYQLFQALVAQPLPIARYWSPTGDPKPLLAVGTLSGVQKSTASSGVRKRLTPHQPNKAGDKEVDTFHSDLDLTSPILRGVFKSFHKPLHKLAKDLKVLGVKAGTKAC